MSKTDVGGFPYKCLGKDRDTIRLPDRHLALRCTVSQQFIDLRFRSGKLHLNVENLVYAQLNAVGSSIVCHAIQIDSVFLQCIVDAVARGALSRKIYFA